MKNDRGEAFSDEAWQEAWREAARELGFDPDADDPELLDLIWDRASELMKDWGIPLPKSVSEGGAT